MSASPDGLEEQYIGRGIITLRSVLLGAFMCLVIGIVGPYWTFYLHSSTLFLDYSVGGAMFLLFVLVLLLNGFLGRYWSGFALRPGEWVVVMVMMLVAGAITTMGLTGYLVPTMTAPYYLANSDNEWATKLWPSLPKWLAPIGKDQDMHAIDLFYKGLPAPEAAISPSPGLMEYLRYRVANFREITGEIPWSYWVRPLAWWGIFLTALYGCMISVMTIMRKQWVDYERLTFPIAQVPQELCATASDPWRPGSLLRNRLFWIGFAIPFIVGSLKALKKFYTWMPTITTAVEISDFGPMPLQVYLSFAVLGFTFLIPNRVAFSLWFLNLLSFAFRLTLKKYALEPQANLGIYGAAGGNSGSVIMTYQGMGAMLVFALASIYFARQHLKRLLLCAWAEDRLRLVGAALASLPAVVAFAAMNGSVLRLVQGETILTDILALVVAAVVGAIVWAAYVVATRLVDRGDDKTRQEREGYSANEPSSYATAFVILGLSMAVMLLWLNTAGLRLYYCFVFLAASMLIFLGLTRVVAQCGVSVTIAPMIPPVFMTSAFGGGNFEAAEIGVLTQSWTWASDIRTTVMGSAAHAMYLTRRKGRGLLPLLMLAAVITFVIATLATIWLGYRVGAVNMHDWFFVSGARQPFNWGLMEANTTTPLNPVTYWWTGVGAVIMGGLIWAQRALFWWPIHPVGFIICSVTWTDGLWFTILLAWVIKLTVAKLGGNRLLRRARRFFLGMILGQFTVAGVWAVFDTFTGTIDHLIFWI